MAPTCRYWARGDCRNGANCRWDHPPRNDNRFAGFQSDGNDNRNSSGRSITDGRSNPQTLPFSLNKDQIIADLSTECPQWILSSYGPGIRAPAQLFGGPGREQSFEEMRLHLYQGAASGSEALAKQQADSLVQGAELQMRNALGDIDGAIEFIRSAQNQHPNRIDICRNSSDNQISPALGQPSAFGQISTLGLPSGPSQPSAFSRLSAFGQPSTLNQPSVFSQQSALGQPSAFGQPSVLGTKPNLFSRPPQGPTLGAGLDQNPGFSNFAGATNSLMIQSQVRPSQPPSQLWSNPINTTANSRAFPGPPLQQNPLGGFLQASETKPLVEPTDSGPSNIFGQTRSLASFTQQPKIANGIQDNPFKSPLMEGNPEPNRMTGARSQNTVANVQHPPLESYASKGADNTLRMFKGNQVIYKEGEAGFRGRDGTWEKIWFPDGAPAHYGATEMDESAYVTDVEQSYLHLRETGSFNQGVMPFIPPKRAWCRWDF